MSRRHGCLVEVDVCATLPSLGSLSIKDSRVYTDNQSITTLKATAPIEVNPTKIARITDGNGNGSGSNGGGEMPWFITENGVRVFNYSKTAVFMRKMNTQNHWVYWYPFTPGAPGVFNFADGDQNFSNFIPHNYADIKATDLVGNGGTHHDDPHFLRTQWTEDWNFNMIKAQIQENNAKGVITTLGEDSTETINIPKNEGCPQTKQLMIAPFVTWCKQHYERTQDSRIRKLASGKQYKTPVVLLDWEFEETFMGLVNEWYSADNDNALEKLNILVKDMDQAPARFIVGKPNPKACPLPPGFLTFQRVLTKASSFDDTTEKLKPGQKTDESIFIGPRWKEWIKGKEGYVKTALGYTLVNERSPRDCWLTYINSQTSGKASDNHKKGKSTMRDGDHEGEQEGEQQIQRANDKSEQISKRRTELANQRKEEKLKPKEAGPEEAEPKEAEPKEAGGGESSRAQKRELEPLVDSEDDG